MKILHISPESPEDKDIIGGRGIFLKHILPIQAKEHDVKILTFCSSGSMKRDNYEIISVTNQRLKPVPADVVGEFKEDNFNFLKEAVNLFKTWKPDVIHLHDADCAEAVIALKEIYNIPLVYTIHLSAIACFIENISRQTYQQYLCQWEQQMTRLADVIHVCSNYYKDKFYTGKGELIDYWYMTDKPVKVVPNGVDPKSLDKAGEEIDDSYYNVFYAGRLTKGKGIETICEIIEEMKDCRFFFAGTFNGTEEQRKRYPTTKVLDELAEKYSSRVKLLGQIKPHSAMGKVAKQMDVWLCPSWHCPFELVGLEAMACNVPVILTKTGAFLEYGKDEENCLMIEPKNAKQLKEAIYKIVKNKFARSELEKGVKETLRKYSWVNTVKGLDNIYKEVTNGSAVRVTHAWTLGNDSTTGL